MNEDRNGDIGHRKRDCMSGLEMLERADTFPRRLTDVKSCEVLSSVVHIGNAVGRRTVRNHLYLCCCYCPRRSSRLGEHIGCMSPKAQCDSIKDTYSVGDTTYLRETNVSMGSQNAFSTQTVVDRGGVQSRRK